MKVGDVGQFKNNTNIPHVNLPEHPKSNDEFKYMSKDEKAKYINGMITDCYSESQTDGVDTIFNPLTGEAVKVPTGVKVTANQDSEGNISYKMNPVMKWLGGIVSDYKNKKNASQGKDPHYYSKPDVYKQGEYPTDIQHQINDYPYIETAIEEAKKRYEEQNAN